jgi:putative heme iron utilization protein
MSNQEIRDMFDSNPNMTVAQLARIAGKSNFEIKRILLESK